MFCTRAAYLDVLVCYYCLDFCFRRDHSPWTITTHDTIVLPRYHLIPPFSSLAHCTSFTYYRYYYYSYSCYYSYYFRRHDRIVDDTSWSPFIVTVYPKLVVLCGCARPPTTHCGLCERPPRSCSAVPVMTQFRSVRVSPAATHWGLCERRRKSSRRSWPTQSAGDSSIYFKISFKVNLLFMS